MMQHLAQSIAGSPWTAQFPRRTLQCRSVRGHGMAEGIHTIRTIFCLMTETFQFR